MALLLQVLFLNFIIACENIGVLALATNGLSPNKATKARRIGIGTSLAFKLILIAVAGFLFVIPWLHIRIVGGILLLYTTFNILLQHSQESGGKTKSKSGEKDSFTEAVLSITAAVISMSLDDAIAISGIISTNGSTLDFQKTLIVLIGLLFGAFILWVFSGTLTTLIERFSILNYLFAGYLAYMAIKMIFEDDTLKLFFDRINFTFTVSGAVLCGILIAFYGLFVNGIFPGSTTKESNTNLPFYCIMVVYSLITIGTISYLNTIPIVEGHRLSAELVYGFMPNGANAIYTIATSSNGIVICAAIFEGTAVNGRGEKTYISTLLSSAKGMIVFILLTLFINTIGLSFSFNVGTIRPLQYLALFLIQVLLLLSYTAAFNLMYVFIKRKALLIISCLLYTMLESGIAAAVASNDRFLIIAYFFPSYHFAALLGLSANTYSISTAILIPVLYIGLFTYIGYCGDQSRNRMSVSAK
ncbi:TerC family protein [Lacrimispora sp.]|uniref:TerC family protein n=1 Tax=Lacrimispora sp. TaxID=2719234 RepID=UPI0028A7019D|nr:hypothetical protein [Lacrimispora sp.]